MQEKRMRDDLISRKAGRMSDWMIFAERLSEQMEKQNLSIRQLAERMNMTPTTIFRYAKGQRVPRASEILKASDALGVTCDYLIGLSDDPKKTSRPSAQPNLDEWCTDCKEYDKEKHSCPRFNRVIREALKDAQSERKPGHWEIYIISMLDGEGCRCSECGFEGVPYWDFCPNCGADMRGNQE